MIQLQDIVLGMTLGMALVIILGELPLKRKLQEQQDLAAFLGDLADRAGAFENPDVGQWVHEWFDDPSRSVIAGDKAKVLLTKTMVKPERT